MKCFVYYDKKSEAILDFLPSDIPSAKKNIILELWSQEIPRKILKLLTTEDGITAPAIKDKIGHSMSTLHENIKKLEDAQLISTEMIYTGNKQKIIHTNVMCVSRNTRMTETITRFLNQGLWVDSERSNTIIKFLDNHPDMWFTAEEISARTGIQIDEVQTLLNNWDSLITRSFSDFLKRTPFEKKIAYKSRKK